MKTHAGQPAPQAPKPGPTTLRWATSPDQVRLETADHFRQAALTLVPRAHAIELGQKERLTDFVRLAHYLMLAAPGLGLGDLQPLLKRIHNNPHEAWDDSKELLFLLNNPRHRQSAVTTGAKLPPLPKLLPAYG